MAIPLLGAIAGLALRFPTAAGVVTGTGGFIKRHWKWFAAGAACVSLYFAATAYLNHRDQANYDRGYSVAEKQAQDLVTAANERERIKQHDLDLITQRFAFLAANRERDVTTIVQPQIERITHEVQSNPIYSACALTPGVLDATNTAIAGVNASIGALAPAEPR